MENVLDLMRAEKLPVDLARIDLMLAGVDRLRQMIGGIGSGAEVAVGDLVSRLQAAIAGAGAPPETALPEILRQDPKPEAPERASIRIPAAHKAHAEAERRHLALVFLDLYKQECNSLLELRQMIEGLEDNGFLLMQGVLAHLLPKDGKPGQTLLPYYFLLSTPLETGEFLARQKINGRILKKIHTPAAVAPTQPAGAVSGGSAGDTPAGGIFAETIPAEPYQPSPPVASAETLPVEPVAATERELSPQQSREGGAETHLKVHVELLNELINLAGETIIARNDLVQRVEKTRDPGLLVASRKVSYLVTKLQESIMRTRLQEINTVFQRMPRLVRDLGQITGKKADLVTEGGDVELDKTLIDAIVDPLMHMVRNSIDHGIEAADVRRAAGKPEKGTLKISAMLRGGNVVIQIADDGKGLDPEKLRRAAVTKGLMSEKQAAEALDEELYELIFEPGFSTATTVTQTSGRGVGMDVVRTNFKRIGGSVDVTSQPGRGMTITATLPQTLSIITCLMIEITGKLYALPQQNIESLILIDPQQITVVEDHQMYSLRGHLLPLIGMAGVLYPEQETAAEPKYIAVVRSDRHRFGMLIDEIINPEEIVVKPLGEHFSDVLLFSGAAIMGDGQAVLILDVPGLARFTNMQSNLREELEAAALAAREVRHEQSGHLLIGICGERFALPVNSVPRIERLKVETIQSFMGLETIIFNREIIPLIRLETAYRLARNEAVESQYVLIFDVNGMRVGIVADTIHNVVDSIPNLETGAYLGESVLGHAIIDDRKTIVLDVLDLLTRMQSTRFRELREHLLQRDTAETGEAGKGA